MVGWRLGLRLGARRLLLFTSAMRHAGALNMFARAPPMQHRGLRCGPKVMMSWDPPPGFKEWKEGEAPFEGPCTELEREEPRVRLHESARGREGCEARR